MATKSINLDGKQRNKYFLVCANEWRKYGGLNLYNKTDDGIFDLIALFCKDFTFHKTESNAIISDDRLELNTIKNKYGSVLFGDFLYVEHENIFEAIFFMNNTCGGHIGFGFATKEFDAFTAADFNCGKNHSAAIWPNSLYNSDEFGKGEHNSGWNRTRYNQRPSFETGCFVKVTINMKTKMGIIESKKKEQDEFLKIFSIGLPECVAIMVSFGFAEQRITVKESGYT